MSAVFHLPPQRTKQKSNEDLLAHLLDKSVSLQSWIHWHLALGLLLLGHDPGCCLCVGMDNALVLVVLSVLLWWCVSCGCSRDRRGCWGGYPRGWGVSGSHAALWFWARGRMDGSARVPRLHVLAALAMADKVLELLEKWSHGFCFVCGVKSGLRCYWEEEEVCR